MNKIVAHVADGATVPSVKYQQRSQAACVNCCGASAFDSVGNHKCGKRLFKYVKQSLALSSSHHATVRKKWKLGMDFARDVVIGKIRDQ